MEWNNYPSYDGQYDPSHCVLDTMRARNKGPQHTCDWTERATCPAPNSWTDHCHVYKWALDAHAGDSGANEHLFTYYLPRAKQLGRKYFSFLNDDELLSFTYEALFITLRRYDPTRDPLVPLQAFIRARLRYAISDQLRRDGSDGNFSGNRYEAEFNNVLKRALDVNPNMTEKEAAQTLLGARSQSGIFSQERIDLLMRNRHIRRTMLSLDKPQFSDSEYGAHDVVEATTVDTRNPEQTLLTSEASSNASAVVDLVFSHLVVGDKELLYAFIDGHQALMEWARENKMSTVRARKTAENLLSTAQERLGGNSLTDLLDNGTQNAVISPITTYAVNEPSLQLDLLELLAVGA